MHSGFAPEEFSGFEDHECGHGLYSVGGGEGFGLVDVDFDDVGLLADGCFHFFDDGVHGFAGSAPCCEHVDEGGSVLVDDFLEGHSGMGYLGRCLAFGDCWMCGWWLDLLTPGLGL